MALIKNDYLRTVINSYKMAHVNDLLDKYRERRKEIKDKIDSKYGTNIYNPMNSGSYAKHTAINNKFDLDMVVPFKKNAFSTLEEMFDDIYNFLSDEYNSEANIRKQKVSVGLEFYKEDEGDSVSIDVVPGRELNLDQYSTDFKLNLFVNSKYGTLTEKSHIQTNIKSQIEHIHSKNSEREIIRLLKIWKTLNKEEYKSFLLELITIKAFDKANIDGDIWEKLESVMKYIRDNITQDGFSLYDPGNSGNDVINTLEWWQKENLSNKMSNMLDRISENSDNLKIYFPVNPDYEDAKKNNSGNYGFKEGAASGSFSKPPKNERFG